MTVPDYQFHPLCLIFPAPDRLEVEAMAEDLQKLGQLEPILLYDGKIIDGRLRYLACRMLGITPWIEEWSGDDPAGMVHSRNLIRRHYGTGQRALAAAALQKLFEEHARERQKAGKPTANLVANLPQGQTKGNYPSGNLGANFRQDQEPGRSREKAAQLAGVSSRTVGHAAKITEKGVPELVEAVKGGQMAVSAASRVADLPPEEQVRAIRGEIDEANAALEREGRKETLAKVSHCIQRAISLSEKVDGSVKLVRALERAADIAADLCSVSLAG